MDENIENEEEQKISQKVYQDLNERADLQRQAISLQEETISLQREQLQLKDQLIEKLEYELELLGEHVRQIQDRIDELSAGRPTPPVSVRFSRPLKKHRRQHG